jgi:hypothetical protein
MEGALLYKNPLAGDTKPAFLLLMLNGLFNDRPSQQAHLSIFYTEIPKRYFLKTSGVSSIIHGKKTFLKYFFPVLVRSLNKW